MGRHRSRCVSVLVLTTVLVLTGCAKGDLPSRAATAPVPEVTSQAQVGDTRVRGLDYRYSVPVGWTQVHERATPQPDTMVAPKDPNLSAFIAVDRPFTVGSQDLAHVVAELRQRFTGTGTIRTAPDRQVAGFRAAGLVIDASATTRHRYYIAVYAERVFPIRVTYDPDRETEALAALNGVLQSWTWG